MRVWVGKRGNHTKQQCKVHPEFREETAQYVVESGKSATSVAEEIGIDKGTVCTWVRAYRKKNGVPSYAEEKGIHDLRPKDPSEESQRIRDLEKENRRLRKELLNEQEKVEILKKSLHIFIGAQE